MASCQSIPVLYIRAKSNYDVGLTIGRTFQHFISSYVSSRSGNIVQSFYESPEGKEVYNEALAAAEKDYPHIVDEIRGMAEGCGLPFQTLFLNNMVSDILMFHSFNEEEYQLDKGIAGCTDVIVNTEDLRLIGHTEDWEDDVDNRTYFIHVEIDKQSNTELRNNCGEVEVKKTLSLRNERFLAFLFPGNIAGNASFVNRKFVFTINSLMPAHVNKGAVPVDILLRALAGCESIEECVAVMKNEPMGCSYGINVNIASRETKDMWSLEVYPSQGKTVVELEHIPYQSKQEKPQHYVHANHYKHMENTKELPITRGSIAREATASSMPTPRKLQDVCNILGDMSGPVDPIFKIPGNDLYEEHLKTVATLVYDINESTVHVYLNNPKEAQAPSMSLPFVK